MMLSMCCRHLIVSRNFRQRLIHVVIVAFSFCGGMLHNDAAAANGDASVEFFEKHVRPILVEHCLECHSTDEANGGLLLDSRLGWQRGGDTGPAIVPGDLKRSLLIEAVRYQNHDLQMPPQNRLSENQIAILERWVVAGAADPREAELTGAKPIGMSVDEGFQFWSFRPVTDPAAPAITDPDRALSPIDAFVFSRLESAGLQPAPDADRRDWIRRVTFDLTGLPPTAVEVDGFLADESPRAFEKVVERLLASPQYGVRWGRHWLDVARYADSNGLDENLAFGNAWRYRDYVINAFNEDKPFDRFLIEQIAGDLVPGANRNTRIATGFLSLGAKVLAEPDRDKLEMDMIDEQLDTTGKAFLGMTLGCVRCHDHKFDPVKQSDYYALAAIFKGTKTLGDTKTGAIKHWYEYEFASDEELAHIQTIDKEIAAKKKLATDFKNRALQELRTKAQSQAAEYLAAAAKFGPDSTLKEVQQIAEPLSLHPRILHHCRLHLQYHSDEPLFARWHEICQQTSSVEERYSLIRQHYWELLARDEQDPKVKAARAAINDRSGFLAVPPKPEFAFDFSTLEEYNQLMEAARLIESAAPDLSAAMGVMDGQIHPTLPIHIRGSHRNFGEQVQREFPQVMRTSRVRPVFPANQSGRLELARWMASTQHPLTARVYVNRVWRWHFGTGLVATTENFGVLGDRPSHPQLLDWLARRFMQSGWSTKELHRLILSSRTYRLASSHPRKAVAAEIDPENRLLWKFHQPRLDAEQIRDAVLVQSGRLDWSLGGKTVPLRNRQFVFNHTSVDHTKYDSLRRAAFLPVIRNNVYTLFEQFDFPDPTMPTGDRKSTTVAPQALLLMNSGLVIDSSRELAGRLLAQASSDASRVEAAYMQVLGRSPTAAESQRVLQFIDGVSAESRLNSSEVDEASVRDAWALFCQSLFSCNEFMYLR